MNCPVCNRRKLKLQPDAGGDHPVYRCTWCRRRVFVAEKLATTTGSESLEESPLEESLDAV